MPHNYQLYALILRLVTDHPDACRRSNELYGFNPQHHENLVRDLIAGDRSLVWC